MLKEKRFDIWMPLKANINNSAISKPRIGYREGDVFWLSIGVNIGNEQDGKGGLFARPVLVVKGFNRNIFWGVPLTSQPKVGKYYYSFILPGQINTSTALLSQLRLLDTARISGKKKLGRINNADLIEIKRRLSQMIW